MTKKENKYGGGAKTNENGLRFEQTTSLDEVLLNAGYAIKKNVVFKGPTVIGMSVPKHKLYTSFLIPRGIDYRKYNSKKWLPDEAFINYGNKTAYIIEKKFQSNSGSVDEKLPSCHFKKLEFVKLFSPLNYKIEYIYVFNSWFQQVQYRDTLEYIECMGCKYFFNEIPIDMLGI